MQELFQTKPNRKEYDVIKLSNSQVIPKSTKPRLDRPSHRLEDIEGHTSPFALLYLRTESIRTLTNEAV
jgi:hypothetical protein